MAEPGGCYFCNRSGYFVHINLFLVFAVSFASD